MKIRFLNMVLYCMYGIEIANTANAIVLLYFSLYFEHILYPDYWVQYCSLM